MAIISDIYAQKMRLAVTQTAANALTFAQVSIGMSLFDYAAMLIHRIEYHVSTAMLAECIGTTDVVTMGLTGSNSIAAINVALPECYDVINAMGYSNGAPASGEIIKTPWIHEFDRLPGGGLLVPAQDFYAAIVSVGMAAVHTVTIVMYYTVKELKANDFLELVQRLRVLST